jgi:hypothetical protein
MPGYPDKYTWRDRVVRRKRVRGVITFARADVGDQSHAAGSLQGVFLLTGGVAEVKKT